MTNHEEARELAGKLIPHTTSVYNVELIQQAFDAHDASKWQPIETYPKDGEQFLVTDGGSVIMAEAPNCELIIYDITSHGFYAEHASHWMRLPDLPNQQV